MTGFLDYTRSILEDSLDTRINYTVGNKLLNKVKDPVLVVRGCGIK